MTTKNNRKKQRKIESKEAVTSFYIFCEGTCTEPNYFNEMKTLIESDPMYKNNVNIEIVGTGKNTSGVFDDAQNYINKKNIERGEIYCVYDKDSFPSKNFNAVEKNIKKLNSDKKKLAPPELHYHAAWSNQCIEYWFILHFNFYDSDNQRNYYIDFLNKKFVKLGLEKYQKNTPNIFSILTKYGNPKNAIKFAERRIEDCKGKTPSDSVPATKVYQLVQKLAHYFPNDIKSKYLNDD